KERPGEDGRDEGRDGSEDGEGLPARQTRAEAASPGTPRTHVEDAAGPAQAALAAGGAVFGRDAGAGGEGALRAPAGAPAGSGARGGVVRPAHLPAPGGGVATPPRPSQGGVLPAGDAAGR